MMSFIKNQFKVARVNSVDDSGNLRFASITTLGKTQKVMMFTPYGLMSNPPENSMALVWSQQGQESNGIGMADDPKNRILKDLEPGEVALGNYETLSYVKFDENGNALLTSLFDTTMFGFNSATVLSIGTTHIQGAPVEINGGLYHFVMWEQLNFLIQVLINNLNTHTHGGGAVPDQTFSIDLTGAATTTVKTSG